MGNRIVYLCGGRNFSSRVPGRKLAGVVDCWRAMGHQVLHLCGGDIFEQTSAQTSTEKPRSEYGSMDFYQQWFRQKNWLEPLVTSASEWRDIVHDAKMKRHIEDGCSAYRPDLIWERSCRLHRAGLWMARKWGVPYVLEWKDHLVDYRYSLFRPYALCMEREKNREADDIVVESGVLRDQLFAEGVAKDKILVAHNAVDSEEFVRTPTLREDARRMLKVTEATVLVGYLGSYAFYHDTARLVMAAKLLLRQKPSVDIKILMVGAGEEYAESRQLAESLGILDDILVMRPGVPKEEVPRILCALDIAVLPGSTDIICPIKIQEYMAVQLPTLAPDYECNREVIQDGVDGALFRPKDERSLADAILRLAQDPALCQTMGKRARQTAIDRFSWRATWGQALETILARHRIAR